MSSLLDRFVRYVKADTQSDAASHTVPSTPGQVCLQKALQQEMEGLGMETRYLDGVVYGFLPGEGEAVGFLAHVDTAPGVPADHVHPCIRMEEETLVTSDGTTLLGADDKAGIAIILTAIEELGTEPHRPVYVAFTSDEEIGRGMDHFHLDLFPAAAAYTVDGDAPDFLDTETFHAAICHVEITGREIHPGEAYGVMVNAGRVAAQIAAALPADQAPETTRDREGYYHLDALQGDCGTARLDILVRDHDRERYEHRKAWLENLLSGYVSRVPEIRWEITDQYRNMMEYCDRDLEPVLEAFRNHGLHPVCRAVRGGTDGARLSEMGLYTPNLGTGSYRHHSRQEFASLEQMEQMVRLVKGLMKGEG